METQIKSPTLTNLGWRNNRLISSVRVCEVGPETRLKLTREAIRYVSARKGVGGKEIVVCDATVLEDEEEGGDV